MDITTCQMQSKQGLQHRQLAYKISLYFSLTGHYVVQQKVGLLTGGLLTGQYEQKGGLLTGGLLRGQYGQKWGLEDC